MWVYGTKTVKRGSGILLGYPTLYGKNGGLDPWSQPSVLGQDSYIPHTARETFVEGQILT